MPRLGRLELVTKCSQKNNTLYQLATGSAIKGVSMRQQFCATHDIQLQLEGAVMERLDLPKPIFVFCVLGVIAICARRQQHTHSETQFIAPAQVIEELFAMIGVASIVQDIARRPFASFDQLAESKLLIIQRGIPAIACECA